MAQPSATNELLFTWEQRVVSHLPLSVLAAAFAIAAALYALYLASAYAIGFPVMEWERDLRLPVGEGAWTALVHSLLCGFGVVGVGFAITRGAGDLAALAPVSRGRSAQELRDMWAESIRGYLPTGRVVGAVAAVLGMMVPTSLAWAYSNQVGWREVLPGFVWFCAVSPLMVSAISRAAFFNIVGLRAFSRAADGVEVDLLDLQPLAAFGRVGLRNALSWILVMTIFSLYFLNIPAAELFTAFPFMGVVVVLAVAALVVPFAAAHRAIARAKQEELAQLRAQIRICREKLGASSPEAQSAAAGLPGLLAYEQRIQAVREWPIDTMVMARFALYLAIPVGSWVGGAVVERLLAAAID